MNQIKLDKALVQAVLKNETTQVKSLLRKGADPNTHYNFCLRFAVRGDDWISLIKLLVERGSRVDFKSNWVLTHYHKKKDYEMINYFLRAGSKPITKKDVRFVKNLNRVKTIQLDYIIPLCQKGLPALVILEIFKQLNINDLNEHDQDVYDMISKIKFKLLK